MICKTMNCAHGKVKKIKSIFIHMFLIFIVFFCLFFKSNNSYAETAWNEDSGRVHLFWSSGKFCDVDKKNYFYVYAFEGDTIALGSNVYNASYNAEGNKETNPTHNDENSVDIVLYDLANNPIAVDIQQNGNGYIKDVKTEKLAKEMESINGNGTYKPYTYKVTETGVYKVEFRSYDGKGGTGSYDQKKTAELMDPSKCGGIISAWDVSVFNENGQKEHGRTYANYLSLQCARNVKEKYYVLTSDSYIYEVTFNSISPYTFTLFSNNKGLIDSATGDILYKSGKSTSNGTISLTKFGVTFQHPGGKETDFNKNNLIFFEKPNEDLEGYLFKKAYVPDSATNIQFLGQDVSGTKKEIIQGTGGYFGFDVKEATSATLRIEFNIDGKKFEPVEITNTVKPYSTNYFYWDGKDGKGVEIPADTYSSEEISYSVTTKAGEMHLPLMDMEESSEGITITRVNDIYNKNNEKLNIPNSIYEKAKSVVYYDDTAIYYGEQVGSTGLFESDVDVVKGLTQEEDGLGGKYYTYGGTTSGEYSMYQSYGKSHSLRIGDHSHTNNIIDYSQNSGQDELINYLDSLENPVGKAKGTIKVGSTSLNSNTTDYGIANYWTFTPSKKEKASTDSSITITSNDTIKKFNLKSRVFYDVDFDGVYDPQADNDYLLSDVNLKLYKKTKDEEKIPGKIYVYKDGNNIIETSNVKDPNRIIYELVEESKTTLDGNYTFSNLEYDEKEGTEYLYQVIKKDPAYRLTSGGKKPAGNEQYGRYKLYGYGKNVYGTEIQEFKVGGTEGATPINGMVTTIDVGYYYDCIPNSLKITKNWNIDPDSPYKEISPVIFEVSYVLEDSGETGIYEMRPISQILSETKTYEYLEKQINEKAIKDYYISAEYYIFKGKIYKAVFDYDKDSGIYKSFVAKNYYFDLDAYYTEKKFEKPADSQYTMEFIPDFNEDSVSNYDDLEKVPSWTEISNEKSDGVVAPYNSVLDRNIGTAVTEISVKNTTEPGTIEVLKYTGTIDAGNYLKGATFRVYKGQLNDVKSIIEKYDQAQIALNNATSEEEKSRLKKEFDDAALAVSNIQIDSITTRSNGRVAFSGLDPEETYTVRERFAPSGYRILSEYYQVNPKNSPKGDGTYEFDNENYCLVQIGNAKADGDFEIKKQIDGRTWVDEDKFSFDINFTYSETDKSGVTIPLDEQVLVENYEEKVENFVNQFNSKTNNVEIDYYSDYAKDSNDTKVSKKLLESGTEEGKSASLNGVDFPAKGTYTFRVTENDVENNDAIKKSLRMFTVVLNVDRHFNVGSEEEKDFTIDNSHLEVSISKITYQDLIEGSDQYTESIIFAGNDPTFVNKYVVEELDQETQYTIKKNLIGWDEKDKFNFTISGGDDVTEEALKTEKIKLEGDFTENEDKTEKYFTLSKTNSAFKLKGLDFSGVKFSVSQDEDGNKVSEPVIYYLNIKENVPEGNSNNIINGIKYSSDSYTLKAILKNDAEDGTGEADGIIDEIIFELYKNYKPEASNTKIGECIIKQHKDGEGNTVQTATHNDKTHSIVFDNSYVEDIKVSKIWNDTDETSSKRPHSIDVKLIPSSGKEQTYRLTGSDISEDEENKWEHTFKNLPKYDSKGNKITYTVEEIPVKKDDLKFYETTIAPLVSKEKEADEIVITNNFTVPNEEVVLHLEKIWDYETLEQKNKIPEKVKFVVSTDDKKVNLEGKQTEITLTNENKTSEEDNKTIWQGAIEGLPKYNSIGDEVVYKVNEVLEDNLLYKQEGKTQLEGETLKYTITNKFERPSSDEYKTDIKVTKNWDDETKEGAKEERPDSIRVILKLTGEVETDEKDKQLILDEANGWTATFKDLYIYDKNGDKITYSVEEQEVISDDLHYYKKPVVEPNSLILEKGKENIFTITNETQYEQVTVKFLDENGKRLLDESGTETSPEVKIKGITGQSFNTEKQKIEANVPEYYELVSVVPEEGKGTFGSEEEVVYTYKLKEYDYKVNYLEKGTDDELNTPKEEKAVYGTKLKAENFYENILGYNHEEDVPTEITIGTEKDKNVINIYYTKKNDLKYTVKYYEVLNPNKPEEERKEEDIALPITVENNTFKDTINPEDATYSEGPIKKEIDGFTYKFSAPEELEIQDPEENNVLKLYYERNEIEYSLEFYYNFEKRAEKTVKNKALFDTEITYDMVKDYITKNTEKGYRTANETDGKNNDPKIEISKEGTSKLPLKIVTDSTQNVIKVYYVPDEKQQKTLKYTVEYYKNGSVDGDAIVQTQDVQVLKDDTIAIDKNVINTENKYGDGYILDKIEIVDKNGDVKEVKSEDDIPNIVNTETTIKVYYIKRSDLKYTVNYYEKLSDGSLLSEPLIPSITVENQVFETEINSTTTYGVENEPIKKVIDGYNFVQSNPETLIIGTKENIINLYYTKRTNIKYTVNYHFEWNLQDTYEGEAVYKDIIETNNVEKVPNKIKDGYRLATIDEMAEKGITSTVNGYDKASITISTDETNNVINVYYVIDNNQRKTLKYTVEYYKENTSGVSELQSENTLEETKDVQLLEKDILEVHKENIDTNEKYGKGYKLDKVVIVGKDGIERKVEVDEIPNEVDSGTVIRIYYVRKSFNYVIKYYYGGVEDPVNKIEGTKLYGEIVAYEDRPKEGYSFDYTDPKEGSITIKEYDGLNIINVYYKKNPYSYTINYYYDNVKEEKATINETADFDTEINYDSKLKPGYVLEKTEPSEGKIRISTDATKNVINVYYVRKESTIKIKYIDMISNAELTTAEEVTGKVFDTYDVLEKKKNIPGYELVESPNPSKIEFVEDKVVEVTFYYAKQTKVIVKYVEKDTNNILQGPLEIPGYENKPYTTNKKEIAGYTYVGSTDNVSGNMTVDPITEVIYYYLQNTQVVVEHVDRNTETVMETETYSGKVGDTYETKAKDFSGYALVEEPSAETKSGKMVKGGITLRYYYAKISEGVNEKHIDKYTNRVLHEELHKGNEGDSYKIDPKTFDGYDLVEEMRPANSEGIFTVETQEVKYYYIRKIKVVAKYIDVTTGNEIIDSIVQNGHEGDPYKTEAKELSDWVYLSERKPDNSEGIMTVTIDSEGNEVPEIEVKYYYAPRAGGVLEKHIDVKSGKVIESKRYDGKIGDSYITKEKEIEGYDIVESMKPTNPTGTMTKEQIEVNYFYIRKTKVIVEYIDKISGEKLQEIGTYGEKRDSTEEILGHEGDPYETIEKTFENYEIIKEEYPNNTTGTMVVTSKVDGTAETVTYVRYYYIFSNSKVNVEYIDVMTGNKIKEDKLLIGNEGTSYEIKDEAIDGWDIVKEVCENQIGSMSKNEINVKLYYIKKTRVVVEYREVGVDKKIADDVVINGHEGDSYKAEQKDIENFNFVKSTQNTSGDMTKEEIKVIYYYEFKKGGIIGNIETGIVGGIENIHQGIEKIKDNRVVKETVNVLPLTGDEINIALKVIIVVIILNLSQISIAKVMKVRYKDIISKKDKNKKK